MSDLKPAPTLTALIDEHYELIYRYAYRLCGRQADAEDLTQQTFLAAQAHQDQLRDAAASRAWLCSIVRNAFLQGKRRRLRTVALADGVESLMRPVPADGIDSDELQAALATLPEEFRSPLVLFYFREFSYKDIASALNVPLGTVMSRLSRGKSLLRQRLAPDEAAEKQPTDRRGLRVAVLPQK